MYFRSVVLFVSSYFKCVSLLSLVLLTSADRHALKLGLSCSGFTVENPLVFGNTVQNPLAFGLAVIKPLMFGTFRCNKSLPSLFSLSQFPQNRPNSPQNLCVCSPSSQIHLPLPTLSLDSANPDKEPPSRYLLSLATPLISHSHLNLLV